MMEETIEGYNKQLYYRLIALWVVCEAFAGGIMHGLKVPFTGMIVSSLAIICITLIAWYVPVRFVILKATLIVAIFKLMLSPHSPPPAYIAVFFQGLLGELLFTNSKKRFKVAAVILATIALVESAIQRILVLVILYGNHFWKAVNEFIQNLTKEKNITNYSLYLAIGYILLHALAGVMIGFYAAGLAKRSAGWDSRFPEYIFKKGLSEISSKGRNKKVMRIKIVFIIIWILLAGLLLQSVLSPKEAIMPSNIVVQIIARSVLIMLSWYLIISPAVSMILKRVLQKEQLKNQQQVNAVMLLLPATKYIFLKSWELSATKKGGARLKIFFRILLTNILSEENQQQ